MVSRVLAVVLGVLFTSSGALKLATLNPTTQTIGEYLPLGSTAILYVLVVVVSAIEVFVGVLLLESPGKEHTSLGAVGAVLLSGFFMGIVLSRNALGETGDCGCLGALQVVTPGRAEIIKSAFLLAVSSGLLVTTSKQRNLLKLATASAACLLLGAIVVPVAQGIPVLPQDWSFVDQPLGDWYGYPDTVPTGELARSIAVDSESDSMQLRREPGTPLYAILDRRSGHRKQIGWYVSLYIPAKVDKRYKIIRLEVEYSIDGQPLQVGIQLSDKRESKAAQDFCNKLLLSIRENETTRFVDPDRIERDGSLAYELASPIVHALNSTTNGVLIWNLSHMTRQ